MHNIPRKPKKMSEIWYILNFKRKNYGNNKFEKSMKNEKNILENSFGRISNTKFLAKTFVVTGQTQSQKLTLELKSLKM